MNALSLQLAIQLCLERVLELRWPTWNCMASPLQYKQYHGQIISSHPYAVEAQDTWPSQQEHAASKWKQLWKMIIYNAALGPHQLRFLILISWCCIDLHYRFSSYITLMQSWTGESEEGAVSEYPKGHRFHQQVRPSWNVPQVQHWNAHAASLLPGNNYHVKMNCIHDVHDL